MKKAHNSEEKRRLPTIVIIATGGTIAGIAAKASHTIGYTAGMLKIEDLAVALPDMGHIANICTEQFCSIDSKDITEQVWLQLKERISILLAEDSVDGIVVTHGTDTMEETAYFLNLLIKSEKPVVLVGAMRPATAISADGPLNLLDAVRVAADLHSQGQGVLVVMNGEIYGARDVVKTNTLNVATFCSFAAGALGYVEAGRVNYFSHSERRHTFNSEFVIENITKLPRVDIIYAHANDDVVLVAAAVAAGAKGIIHAGMGNGSIHSGTEPGLIAAIKQGLVVVKSSRVISGSVISPCLDDAAKYVTGSNLTPQKARVLLQIALTMTSQKEQLQRIFDEY